MKLIALHTHSHTEFKDEWFLPSLMDDYEVQLLAAPLAGGGRYMEGDWVKGVMLKSDTIIRAIKDNWGEVIVYSDVDIQFFAPTRPLIEAAISNHDIVCQKNDPAGTMCTGFFAIRCNEHTLRIWEQVRALIPQKRRDQLTFNGLLKQSPEVRVRHLPTCFFGGGTFTGSIWTPGQGIRVPLRPVMHHANWCVGHADKVAQLKAVRAIVEGGWWEITKNNWRCRLKGSG